MNSNEFYDKVRKEVEELIEKGESPKNILEKYKDIVSERKISQATLLRYIADATNRLLITKIDRKRVEKVLPPEMEFIYDFIVKWGTKFEEETRGILMSRRIKKKIPPLSPYIRDLERMYRIIRDMKNITETKEIVQEEKKVINIRMPEGE